MESLSEEERRSLRVPGVDGGRGGGDGGNREEEGNGEGAVYSREEGSICAPNPKAWRREWASSISPLSYLPTPGVPQGAVPTRMGRR